LLQELNATTPGRRAVAAIQLAKMRPDDARAEVALALGSLLEDRDDSVVRAALGALQTWGTADCVPAVISILRGHRSSFVRHDAIELLRAYPGDETANALADRLSDSFDSSDALEALVAMGSSAEKHLARALPNTNELTQRKILEALKSIIKQQVPDSDTVQALIDFSRKSSDPFAMRDVIQLLSKVKEDHVAEALAMGIPDIRYSRDVAAVLVEFGPVAEPAVMKYLRHESPQTRELVCQILAQIGTRKSLPALQALTKDFFTAREARQAIDAINQRAKEKK
jgi:HEAT repeat protein